MLGQRALHKIRVDTPVAAADAEATEGGAVLVHGSDVGQEALNAHDGLACQTSMEEVYSQSNRVK
jgi:hypothetical protein